MNNIEALIADIVQADNAARQQRTAQAGRHNHVLTLIVAVALIAVAGCGVWLAYAETQAHEMAERIPTDKATLSEVAMLKVMWGYCPLTASYTLGRAISVYASKNAATVGRYESEAANAFASDPLAAGFARYIACPMWQATLDALAYERKFADQRDQEQRALNARKQEAQRDFDQRMQLELNRRDGRF